MLARLSARKNYLLTEHKVNGILVATTRSMTKTTSAMFMADARYTMMGPSPSDFGRTPLLVTRATLERALSGRVSRKTARTTKVAAVANAGTPFRRDHGSGGSASARPGAAQPAIN